jgi:hypothetical protein
MTFSIRLGASAVRRAAIAAALGLTLATTACSGSPSGGNPPSQAPGAASPGAVSSGTPAAAGR